MAADEKSKAIVDNAYTGSIKITTLAIYLRVGGLQPDEILRRVRIAERVGDNIDPTLIGLSEAIAEQALERWDRLLRTGHL